MDRRTLTRTAAAFALASCLAPMAQAVAAQHARTTFAPASIGNGQAARLLITNLSDPSEKTGLPPDPCHVMVRWFDGNGRAIGKIQEVDVASQASAVLAGPKASSSAVARARATLLTTVDGCQNTVQANFEVFEAASGITQLMNPGVIRGFNPQPDPPGFQ